MKIFIIATFLGILTFFTEYAFLYLLRAFLDLLALTSEPAQQISWLPRDQNTLLLIMITFAALQSLIKFLNIYYIGKTDQSLKEHQRTKILSETLKYSEKYDSSFIVSIFSEHISNAGGLVREISTLIIATTTLTFLCAYAIYLQPLYFLIAISILSLFLLPLRKTNGIIKKSGAALATEWKESNSILLTGIRNNFLLKIYGKIEEEIDLGSRSITNYSEHLKRFLFLSALRNTLPNFAGLLAITIVLYFHVNQLKTDGFQLLAFFYLFLRIGQNIGNLGQAVGNIKLCLPSTTELYNFNQNFAHDKSIQTVNSKINKNEFTQSIKKNIALELIDIGFAYERNKPVLKDFNLALTTGDRLFIQGESGSGKSTLLKIILGIETPNKGKSLFNGYRTADILPYLSPYVGYCGPVPFLLSGSVRSNLLYANNKTDISDNEIWEVLRWMKIDVLVSNLQNGLDEPLLETTQLSTGQQQRLSLARCYLRNPEIIILDEATANLDEETEKEIFDNITRFKQNKILILISHRPTFAPYANQKIFLSRDL